VKTLLVHCRRDITARRFRCILFFSRTFVRTDFQSVTADGWPVSKFRLITLWRGITGARSGLPYLDEQQQDGQQMWQVTAKSEYVHLGCLLTALGTVSKNCNGDESLQVCAVCSLPLHVGVTGPGGFKRRLGTVDYFSEEANFSDV